MGEKVYAETTLVEQFYGRHVRSIRETTDFKVRNRALLAPLNKVGFPQIGGG